MSGKKILIVEDEALVAASIRKKLLKAGYEVAGVVSFGEEAIEETRNLMPDLVLMDIKLKGDMDGVEAADQIRDSFDIPVIYLTAFSNDEILQRAMYTNPFGYIVKPFNERELHGNIEIALTKHRMEKQIRASEEKFRLLSEKSNDIVFQVDKNSVITYCSPSIMKILGYTPNEVTGIDIRELMKPFENSVNVYEIILKEGGQKIVEVPMLTRDRQKKILEINYSAVMDGDKFVVFQGIGRDITARKHLESQKNLAFEILNNLNMGDEERDTIREIVQLIKGFTGLEAIGVRLLADYDFPYYHANGFSDEFLAGENSLCTCDDDGNLPFNSEGKAELDCICGLVISGEAVPERPCFTQGGSFWTNNIEELIKSEKELLERVRPRDIFFSSGYRSMAVIPLKSDDATFGLLQLNDTREGVISREMVEFFEGIGASIGIALARKIARDDQKKSLQERERVLKKEKRLLMREKKLQKDIMDAIERERERIGQDLHDGLGQNLTAIAFLLEVMHQKLEEEMPELAGGIEEMDQLVNKSIVQTKMISRLLSPSDLNRDGLINALENMASNVSRLFNVTCRVRRNGDFPAFDEKTTENLFYIISEAINNAIKHGGSKNIDICISTELDRISVTVEDDGAGMKKVAERNGGMGLRNMKHRAELINANIETGNRPENGFMVRVIIPSVMH